MRLAVTLRRQRNKLVLAGVVLGSLALFVFLMVGNPQSFIERSKMTVPDRRWIKGGNVQYSSKALVWVLTHPKAHAVSCKAVKETWGRRVDKLLFMSSANDTSLPAIGLGVTEGLRHLTTKTFAAFEYLYANELDNFDWFFKVDDDTYLLTENLRRFLADKDPSEPVVYGMLMRRNDSGTIRDYVHGGSGYIVSRAALRRFGENQRRACVHWDIATEDIMFSWCMHKLNITLRDTKDSDGRELFMYATPRRHYLNKYLEIYRKLRVGVERIPAENGGISEFPVTFHKVRPEDMYEMDTLLYWVRRHRES